MDIEKIVREQIDETLHLSLGTCKDNMPWVSEVHFVYDETLNLYFRSLKSRRHSLEISSNPHVAGNIVKQHAPDEYPHAIYFEGSAVMIVDDEERVRLYPYFHSRLGLSEKILTEARQEDGHQFYKIAVRKWYAFGKFEGPSVQKYELIWNGGER